MIVTQEIKTTAEEFYEYLLRMQQRAIQTTSRGLVDFETIMQGITYECFTSRKKDTHYSVMMTVKPCVKNELLDVTYRTKDAVVHYCYRLKDTPAGCEVTYSEESKPMKNGVEKTMGAFQSAMHERKARRQAVKSIRAIEHAIHARNAHILEKK